MCVCVCVCVCMWRRIRRVSRHIRYHITSYDQTFCIVGEWTYNMHPSLYNAHIHGKSSACTATPHTRTTPHPYPHHIHTTTAQHPQTQTQTKTHTTAHHTTPPSPYLRETRVAVFSRHIDSDSAYNATPHHTTPQPPSPPPYLRETRVAVFSRHIDSDSASENFIPTSDRS